MKISLCVITLNEEANLPRCLNSSRAVVDEIVVLDSGSTDRTTAVAAACGARFETHPWQGFVAQKNRALDLARCDWVLSLDADEELSPALQNEIRALRQANASPDVRGFSMPRCVLYEGRWIRHGEWYPDRLVRLFRKDSARFAGGKVHERLELSGVVRPLRGDIFHYSFKDRADHWARCRHYARLWAESQFEQGRRVAPLAPLIHSCHRWIKAYLLRFGFLDGRQGWTIAAFAAREAWMKYQLLRELHAQSAAGVTRV